MISYKIKKSKLIINDGNKKNKFEINCIYEKGDFCLYECKKYFLNILPPLSDLNEYEFKSLYSINIMERYFSGKSNFPYEKDNKYTYITIIEDKILNYQETVEFWDSLRVMNKLI